MTKYKKISETIQRLVIDNPSTAKTALTWTDVRNPGKKEIEYLRKHYPFSLSHLQASSVKSVAQRPQIEKADEYTFLILHFPVFQGENIVAGEVEFFIGPDYIITLHDGVIESLNRFFSLSKKDSNSLRSYEFESPTILLCEMIEKILLDCFLILDKNSTTIAELENMIFDQKSRQAVSKVLLLRRNIINTRKIMQNHKNIIKLLPAIQTGFAPQQTVNRYYNELLDHSKRFWEFLEIQKEMIEVLNATNESMMNYRISDIMKTLTIFSVIVFPLSLFAAIFGMNTISSMPFVENQYGFWIIILLMFTGSMAMLGFFYKKKWL
jgi:magnesium transporter